MRILRKIIFHFIIFLLKRNLFKNWFKKYPDLDKIIQLCRKNLPFSIVVFSLKTNYCLIAYFLSLTCLSFFHIYLFSFYYMQTYSANKPIIFGVTTCLAAEACVRSYTSLLLVKTSSE